MSRKSYDTVPGITNFERVASPGAYTPMGGAVTARTDFRATSRSRHEEWTMKARQSDWLVDCAQTPNPDTSYLTRRVLSRNLQDFPSLCNRVVRSQNTRC